MTLTYRTLLLLAMLMTGGAHAQQTVDWGVIATDRNTTISFAHYDITRNFTDAYNFSLQGTGDASYAVTINVDPCRNGCGNPVLSYGVFDSNGGMISDSGSVVLRAGDYSFQVRGTGFGAGNSVDYWGTMSFFVSAVPEPSDYLLMAAGLAYLSWALARREPRRAMA